MDILTFAIIAVVLVVLAVGILVVRSNTFKKLKQEKLTLENKNRESEQKYEELINSQNRLIEEINKLRKQNEYNDALIRNIEKQNASSTNNTDTYNSTNNHHTNTTHTNTNIDESTKTNIATNNEYINNSKSINNNTYISNIQNYDINIHGLLSFLQQNLEDQGRKDALQSHDRGQIEIKKQIIYQEVMSHIVQVKNYYKKKIQDHQYKEDYHYKLGTEDTAQEIASSKKKLLDELQEVEKIEKEIKENTNHQYQMLILSYQKGFREAVSIFSQIQLGIKSNNEN